ncbi:hypothetical protein BDQ17DRAFT_1250571 [Cyathus striatus]|nr:hypothetical protein BDQ17DRAFT_1250571 [Cyathus striatus]
MRPISLQTSFLCALGLAPLVTRVVGQTSNLPALPDGVFSAQASVIIDAPLEKVWEAILDFPSYPNWNPFARSMTVANSWWIPIDDQTPQENKRVIIRAQIPPLPLPVDENTPDNALHTQLSFENITTIDTANHRTAWRALMLPQALLDAERWQAVSILEDGKTFYESKEVFYAPVAYVVDALFSQGIQQGFDSQATALKEWVEGGDVS